MVSNFFGFVSIDFSSHGQGTVLNQSVLSYRLFRHHNVHFVKQMTFFKFQLIRTQLNDSLIGSIKRLIISFRRLECDQLFGFFSSNERDQIQTMDEGSIDMSLRHSNWSLSHFLALVSSCQKLLPFIANQLTVCCFRCGRKKAIKKRKIGFYFLCCGVASASQFHSYLF